MKYNMKKKLSKISNFLILVLITVLVLYFSLKDNFNEIVHQILNMNIMWLTIAFIFICLFWIFKSYSIYTFCKKIKNDFIKKTKGNKINIFSYIISYMSTKKDKF